jgi:hypothetical protein
MQLNLKLLELMAQLFAKENKININVLPSTILHTKSRLMSSDKDGSAITTLFRQN